VRGSALLLFLPAVAQARDLSATLSVEQAAGAEQCAGREQLERRVEGILRRRLQTAAAVAELTIEVAFERAPAGAFVARVAASGPKPGQRVLRDSSPSCDALSEAVAVTIALLLDSAQSEANEAAPPPPSTAPTVAPPSSEAESAPSKPAQRSESASWSARASLEAGGGYGLGGSTTLLSLGRVGARYGFWALDLGAAATVPTARDFDAGSVRTSLLFGSLRGCYLRGLDVVLGPCAQLAVGRLKGEGSGYSEGLTTSLPWLAVGLGLATEARLGSRLFVTLEATLWVPTQRQTFSVQNAGIAWESKPIAGVLAAGLGVTLF
jgi:hypothetical protein